MKQVFLLCCLLLAGVLAHGQQPASATQTGSGSTQASSAQAAEQSSKPTRSASTPPQSSSEANAPVLPKIFAGWEQTSADVGTDASKADPTNPDLLKEYGFTDYENAAYAKNGRKLTIKAARFADASGAYGAFTFYKTPEMANEKIGDQASSDGDRVLFYRGNVLVEVKFQEVTPMSPGELRELADDIPLPNGPARNLPTLPSMLPKTDYVRNSAKYVMGPIGLAKIGDPMSGDQIEFSQGAEVAVGRYRGDEGSATLTLISYPTPAIAAERQNAIDAAHSQGKGAPGFFSKRTGPILALVTGTISPSGARSLLAAVNYDADVTWNQNTHFDKKNNLANLLVNIIVLIGVILAISVVAGFAFGGVRILMRKLFPERVLHREEEIEIIRLDLSK